MSSTKSSSTDPGAGAAGPGPSGSSVALVVVMMALLGAFVWVLRPSEPGFQPAPLIPAAPGCPKALHDFIPTNFTEVADLPSEGLGREQKNRALVRLNMEPCTCGCAVSMASCRSSNPTCEISKELVNRIAAEEKDEPAK